jgi:hypothetical protein
LLLGKFPDVGSDDCADPEGEKDADSPNSDRKQNFSHFRMLLAILKNTKQTGAQWQLGHPILQLRTPALSLGHYRGFSEVDFQQHFLPVAWLQ